MSDIDNTLAERGARYGKFSGHAEITQALKDLMAGRSNNRTKSQIEQLRWTLEQKWYSLSPSQKESLEMIAHKIGRILNGDPNYDDSWRDIGGYSELIVKQLNGEDL